MRSRILTAGVLIVSVLLGVAPLAKAQSAVPPFFFNPDDHVTNARTKITSKDKALFTHPIKSRGVDISKVDIKTWKTSQGEFRRVLCCVGHVVSQNDVQNVYDLTTKKGRSEISYSPQGYDTLVIIKPNGEQLALRGYSKKGSSLEQCVYNSNGKKIQLSYDDPHKLKPRPEVMDDQIYFEGYIVDIIETKDHGVHIITQDVEVYEYTPNKAASVRKVKVQGIDKFSRLGIVRKVSAGIYAVAGRCWVGFDLRFPHVGYSERNLRYNNTTNTWFIESKEEE